MDRFGIVTNAVKDSTMSVTRAICDYLEARRKTWTTDNRDFKNTDVILVLGGDGTFIQTARRYVSCRVPFLGINLGTLGFLTAVEKEDIFDALDCLINDDYEVEPRMMLSGEVYHHRKPAAKKLAFNDVVIGRTGFSRLVELKLWINDSLVDIYAADGVIVSTPTGSTGYNLSAGGPIVYPKNEVMVITPICPHSLTARSIVVSGDEKVTVEIGRRRKTQKEEALVTYDGQTAVHLESTDRVEIRRASLCVQTIQLKKGNFYEILRNKIGNVKEV